MFGSTSRGCAALMTLATRRAVDGIVHRRRTRRRHGFGHRRCSTTTAPGAGSRTSAPSSTSPPAACSSDRSPTPAAPAASDRDGDVDVVAYDLATGTTTRHTLHAGLGGDDHNAPALHVRADGGYVAMYSAHAADDLTRWRTSLPTIWRGGSRSSSCATTRPSRTRTSWQRAASTSSRSCAASTSTRTSSLARRRRHLAAWRPAARRARAALRALRPGPGGVVHLITTEQHPDAAPTSIYHGIVDGQPPLDVRRHRARPRPHRRRRRGARPPLAAVPRRTGRAGMDDRRRGRRHRPRVRRRLGASRWHERLPLRPPGAPTAGTSTASPQRAAASTPTNRTTPGSPRSIPTTRHASSCPPTSIPATGAPLVSDRDGRPHHELFDGRTTDGGATWSWTPVTEHSTVDNLRPIIPRWPGDRTALLWLRGDLHRLPRLRPRRRRAGASDRRDRRDRLTSLPRFGQADQRSRRLGASSPRPAAPINAGRSARPRTERARLAGSQSCDTARSGGPTTADPSDDADRCVDQRLQAEPSGGRRHEQQPGIGHRSGQRRRCRSDRSILASPKVPPR